MAVLKSLSFAPLPKLSSTDPTVHRRNKLITRLNQQIALAQDPNFALTRQKWVEGDNGKELRETKKRVRPWWRVADASGNLVLSIRYGAKPISFEKGKEAIVVGKREQLIPTIETVIAAVEAGELDQVLGVMSKTAVQIPRKK
ncbi:MAG: hypothetical protein JSR72_20225 [Proteobacteria bacterium]|nr:hypothetical protein [Pseudomonadota bacterium]